MKKILQYLVPYLAWHTVGSSILAVIARTGFSICNGSTGAYRSICKLYTYSSQSQPPSLVKAFKWESRKYIHIKGSNIFENTRENTDIISSFTESSLIINSPVLIKTQLFKAYGFIVEYLCLGLHKFHVPSENKVCRYRNLKVYPSTHHYFLRLMWWTQTFYSPNLLAA